MAHVAWTAMVALLLWADGGIGQERVVRTFDGDEEPVRAGFCTTESVRPGAVGDGALRLVVPQNTDRFSVTFPLPDGLRDAASISLHVRAAEPIDQGVLYVRLIGADGFAEVPMPAIGTSWTRVGFAFAAFGRRNRFDPSKPVRFSLCGWRNAPGIDVSIDHVVLHAGADGWARDRVGPITFDDPMRTPYVAAHRSSVATSAVDGGGACLDWDVPTGAWPATLVLRPVPEDVGRFRALRLRLRASRQVRHGLCVALDTAAGGALYRYVVLDTEPAALEIPLAFFDRGDRADAGRVTQLSLHAYVGERGLAVRVSVDGVEWIPRVGPAAERSASIAFDRPESLGRLWCPDQPGALTFDADGPAAVWRPGPGRIDFASLHTRALPTDLRAYDRIALHASVDRSVQAGYYTAILRGPNGGEWLQSMPAIGEATTTVELPLDGFAAPGGGPRLDLSRVTELSIGRFEYDASRGSRSWGSGAAVRLRLQRLLAVEGARSGSAWTPAVQSRIDELATRGRDGAVVLSDLLEEFAGDPGVEVRRSIVSALATIGAAARGHLVEVLVDPSPRVAQDASAALRPMGTACAPFVPRLVALFEPDPERAHEVVHVLAIAGEAGVATLVRWLDAPARPVHRLALHGLDELDPTPAMIATFERHLASAEAWRADAAIEALAGAGEDARTILLRVGTDAETSDARRVAIVTAMIDAGETRVDAILSRLPVATRVAMIAGRVCHHGADADWRAAFASLLEDDDAAVRRAAIEAIEAKPELSEALSDTASRLFRSEDPHVRLLALRANPDAQLDRGTTILDRAMHDADSDVRVAAAQWITSRPQLATARLDALIGALDDEAAAVRHAAVVALGHVGAEPGVAEALERALAHDDFEVARAAYRARMAIEPSAADRPAVQAFVESDRWLRWRETRREELLAGLKAAEPEVRAGMALSLAELLGAEAVPDIERLLADDAPMVRERVLAILDDLGAPFDPAGVRRLLDDGSPHIRLLAARLLLPVDRAAAETAILALLYHADRSVCEFAMLTVGQYAIRAAAPKLVRLLKHEDSFVRYHAVTALGSVGAAADAPAVDALLRREAAAKSEVEPAALRTLAALDARRYRDRLLGYVRAEPDPGRHNDPRRIAARGLAPLRDPEARAVLVAAEDWDALVSYTAPDLAARLEAARFDRDAIAALPVRAVLDRIADRTSLEIRIESALPRGLLDAHFGGYFGLLPMRVSALAVLGSMNAYMGLPGTACFLLVDGEVRVVSPDTHRAWWRAQAERWKAGR